MDGSYTEALECFVYWTTWTLINGFERKLAR